MFDSIITFFSNLFDNAVEEVVRLRECLTNILIATAVGVIAILIFKPSMGICVWITLIPWLVSAYYLFSVQRLIRMHLTGEALELMNVSVTNLAKAAAVIAKIPVNVTHDGGGTTITVSTPAPIVASEVEAPAAAKKATTGILDNPFIRKYLRVISGIFLVQTVIFLLLPLYINYTYGGNTTAIIIMMLLVVIAISSLTFFEKMFRFTVVTTVILYSAGLVFALFPQVRMYAGGLTSGVSVTAPSTAKLVNDFEELKKKQKVAADDAYIAGVIAWQEANPDKVLPARDQANLDKARRLGILKASN